MENDREAAADGAELSPWATMRPRNLAGQTGCTIAIGDRSTPRNSQFRDQAVLSRGGYWGSAVMLTLFGPADIDRIRQRLRLSSWRRCQARQSACSLSVS